MIIWTSDVFNALKHHLYKVNRAWTMSFAIELALQKKQFTLTLTCRNASTRNLSVRFILSINMRDKAACKASFFEISAQTFADLAHHAFPGGFHHNHNRNHTTTAITQWKGIALLRHRPEV